MSGPQIILLLKVRYRLAINVACEVHQDSAEPLGDIIECCLNPTPGARLLGNVTGSVSDMTLFHPKSNNILDSRETEGLKAKTSDSDR